jgi:hypothetical protein
MRTIAAVALFAAACTSSMQEPLPQPRERTATVTVTVYTNETFAPPVAGAEVAFVDPNGASQLLTTGADGRVTARMAAGGSVTALVPVEPAGQGAFLSTVMAVEDGDQIVLGWAPFDPGTIAAGTPSCASDMLVATYTGANALGIDGVYLQRIAGNDVQDAAPTSPVGATSTLTVTGAPAGHAVVKTFLHGAGQQWFSDVIDGCASHYEVDLSQGILPWVDAPSLSADATSVHVPMSGGFGGEMLYVMLGYSGATWTIAGPVAAE